MRADSSAAMVAASAAVASSAVPIVGLLRLLVQSAKYSNSAFKALATVNDGDVVVLSGFGAGMAWASAVLRWGGA